MSDDDRYLKIRARVMRDGEIALGPGKVDLLEHIDRCGSISAAARAMGMSYRRAWLLVDAMNRNFRAPLVASSPGGSGGGGAHITDEGRTLIAHYRALQVALRKASEHHAGPLLEALKD